MKIPLEREIHLGVSAAEAWQYLKDLPFLASCIPGARITEAVGDGSFLGEITTKIGPVKNRFGGRMEIVSCDDAAKEIKIQGSGREQSEQSRAALDLTARLLPKGSNESVIQGKADIELIGKLASVGGRLIPAVANAIIDEFAATLQTRIMTTDAQDGGQTHTKPATYSDTTEPSNALSIVKLLIRLVGRLFGR